MRHAAILSAFAAVALAGPATAAPCRLADLHWLAGAWRDDSPGTMSEERWIVGPDDRLVGISWSLHPGAAGGVIEAETIRNDGAGVSLSLRHFSGDLALAREDKGAPMVFMASSCDDHTLVLDGQGDRVGERMTYLRAGDTLTFSGDFIHQGQPVKVEARFQKSGD